jgi:hypothetical protein
MLAEPTTTRTTYTPTIITAVFAKRLSDGKMFKINLEHKLYNHFILYPINYNKWSFETAPAWRLRDRSQFKLFPTFGA